MHGMTPLELEMQIRQIDHSARARTQLPTQPSRSRGTALARFLAAGLLGTPRAGR